MRKGICGRLRRVRNDGAIPAKQNRIRTGVRMRRIITILPLVMLLFACAAAEHRGRLESLELAIEHYAQAMRWQRYDDVAGFHVTREGQKMPYDPDRYKDVRVTSYSITERTVSPEMDSATVKGEFKYYRTSEGTLRKQFVEQSWWYDEKLKAWFLESGLPEFK